MLDDLKRYVSFDPKRIEDVDFWLMKFQDDKNVELIIGIARHLRLIKKMIDELLQRTGLYICPADSRVLVRNNNGEYFIRNNDFSLNITRTPNRDFSCGVDKILQSEFARNIDKLWIVPHEFADSRLVIEPNGLDLSLKENESNSTWFYMPSTDELSVAFNDATGVNPNTVLFAMDIVEFPVESFPEYHQDVIENSGVRDKKIEIVGDFNNSKTEKFSLLETDDRVVLARKKVDKHRRKA